MTADVVRTQQLGSLQVLRAIAALAVAFDHALYLFITNLHLPPPFAYIAFGRFGVQLFFVISGFIMVYASEQLFGQPDGSRLFLARRLLRIVPLYWAVSLVDLIYLLVTYPDLAKVNLTVGYFVASFLFIPYPGPDGTMGPFYGVGWTLDYEMFFYAIFGLAVALRRNIAVLAVSLFLSGAVTLGFLWSGMPQPFAYWCNPIVLEFVTGMLVALVFRSGLRVPPAVGFMLILCGIALCAASYYVTFPPLPSLVMLVIPATIIVAGAVLGLSRPLHGVLASGFIFLGDASYSLYLAHPIAIVLPNRLFPRFIDPAQHPLFYIAMLLTIAIAGGIAAHLFFERPVTSLLRSMVMSRLTRARAVPVASGL